MHLFYTPDIEGKRYTLDKTESRHCVRVLRLKEGDKIQLIDGKGGFYTAEIIDGNQNSCTVECIETIKEYGKRDYKIEIGIAPTKNIDRIEWFMEKSTEIGMDVFTPLLCDHSERKQVKHERLERIITSAVKQSLKAYHPRLNEMTKFMDFIKAEHKGQKFIAHCEEGEEKNLFQDVYKAKSDVCILIGPEGDFSPKEIKAAKEAGFQEISLGNSRLRTETAGLVACHTVNLINRS
ncbi:16S rRNA (uracil(1498)-N(3))-methyltransferase [Marinilabiliaceae bacterium JC040]|nr:16S rRNA (uracil(1498)-N(3))-methyltransferase [Marinilabiliaceae bacterium JC040]